jgi:eukaryotic-like serine/threonine-protein kinase
MSDTCRDFDALIARPAQLTTDEAAKLEAHLASCRSCRELARALKPVSHTAFAATATPDTKLEFAATHALATNVDSAANPAMARDTHHLPETTRYRITGEVGRGGIGRVMQAVDQVLDRPVALKELISTSDGMRGRFMREALITARLQHPSIVPIHDAGQLADRSPFYAMKLVAGHPLDESIAEAKSLAQRLALLPTVLAIADAIAYAHSQRIIHRDLKPQNILVGKYGETIVIDWGLAKDLAGDDPDALDAGPYRATSLDKTVAGAVLGTPAYMAPEQAAGQSVDERADVYALGAILYHVVSGTAPHEGNTLEELVQRVISGDVRRLTEREPEVPRDLAAIVTKAMALEPSARYANAQGLADDLRRFLTGQLVASHSYGTRELLRRWVKRHRGAVTVGLTALLVVAVVATLAIRDILIARADARARLVASYVDRAGLELANGQPARSLAYTIASAQVSRLTPQTRLMAAHALEQLPPLRWWNVPPGASGVFAPGSHDLLLASGDVVRWNPDTDRVLWRVPGRRHGDLKLVDSDTLVFAHDNTVSLVRVADGTSIAELPGSAGAPYKGIISMDASERWLAAGTADRIDLFDLTARTLIASIPFANGRKLWMTADGEHVIVHGSIKEMFVLDRSGKKLATFKAELGIVLLAGDELVYAPDAGTNGIAHLAVADSTGKLRLDLPIGISPITALAVDVTGKRIALGTEDGVVQVRSLESGEALWQASLGDRAGFVLFDGNVLRVASSYTVVGFDVTSGLEVERASLPAAAIGLVASDDHARVAALVAGVGNAVWASTRGELVPLAPTAPKVTDLALAPNGTVITAGEDGEIHELRDGQSVRRLGGGGAINTLARLDDGTLITASADGTIVVRDRDGRELHRFAGGVSATPSPDGRQIATATSDGTVAIWDPATGTQIRTLGNIGPVGYVRWSPDGRRVAALATEGNVSVWDVRGSVVREIPNGNIEGVDIAFSNDGKWLARAGEPADTLFALDGGSDRKLLEASRQGPAIVVAFSPDDKTVLVAGVGFLSTWDIATAAPRLRIATDGFITSAAFFDSGSYIVGGGNDRRVHLWNADSGAEVLAFTLPARPRKIVIDRGSARVAVLAGRGAMVWTVPAFPGTLDDLRERGRCSLDLEVVDAHLRGHSIDIAACNRVPW